MSLAPSVALEGGHSGGRELLGHPLGLSVLFGTEMWERFSYYGMRALLVLYLTKYLLLPGHVEHVWGYGAIKSFFEYFAGPLDVQPLSSLIYGSYTGLIYFTPLPGGWLADRVLGQKRVVVIGIILMALGHFMMAVESLLFPALFLLVGGGGIFKPNTTGQVGSLYAPGDHRRDRAYSIFYVGVNVGAFFAPLVCGTLGEEVGWHYGFGAAGVGMLIALAVYLFGFNHLPEDELTKSKAAHREKVPLTRDERRGVMARQDERHLQSPEDPRPPHPRARPPRTAPRRPILRPRPRPRSRPRPLAPRKPLPRRPPRPPRRAPQRTWRRRRGLRPH